jgi:hypothetical protein
MDLLKTYVLCTKQSEKQKTPENYQCSYYKTLEELQKIETQGETDIFEIYGPKPFHHVQVNHYLAFQCKK